MLFFITINIETTRLQKTHLCYPAKPQSPPDRLGLVIEQIEL